MPLTRADFRFFHRLRVRWAEVDMQAIVFNAHYLMYLDTAITEYWRAIGLRYPDEFLAAGSDTFVRKASIEYHAPARFDDELLARVERVERLTPTIIEVIVRAPLSAKHFQPGQFYRLQNFETLAARPVGTTLAMEGLALLLTPWLLRTLSEFTISILNRMPSLAH